MVNDTLRRALADARLRDVDVATRLGVDPKTVQRWVAGRIPHARHRWGLADMVGRHESDLWPHLEHLNGGASQETVAVYPHRGSVPSAVWRALFGGAQDRIDVLVYSGLFLVEDVEMMRLIASRARGGVRVRMAFGDPESPYVRSRGAEEGIDDALGAKIRSALVLCRPLLDAPRVEIRRHATVLYNSLYRADDEVLVNAHVYGVGASRAPVLHLRSAEPESLTATYLESFERVWVAADPVS
ncbi:XRE family transcriptional regulator [Cryptosporangium sp. NPDC051539]|uniref:XRE family transcriptional regulator n=1 Tax=Cryptosporangium sp. NPDC051539 TaxID=3363962 RepID=UPI0037A3534B